MVRANQRRPRMTNPVFPPPALGPAPSPGSTSAAPPPFDAAGSIDLFLAGRPDPSLTRPRLAAVTRRLLREAAITAQWAWPPGGMRADYLLGVMARLAGHSF